MKKQCLFLLGLAGTAFVLGCGAEQSTPSSAQAEIEQEETYIALTFDDGPKQGTTDRLLDGLRDRGASATFFLIGSEIEGNEDLIRRMQEEGHQVGNHTWSHVSLKGASGETLLQEVDRTQDLLEELLGEGDYWLRPPYGLVNPEVETHIQVPMVKWSVDPRDWESRNTDKVVQAVLSAVKPNSIVLLHDIYAASVEAALQIVDTLQKEGYVFVTVEELLEKNGVEPQLGVLYCKGTG